MANKDYRELQLSSSQLVLIFVAILILGVVILVSSGKGPPFWEAPSWINFRTGIGPG